MSAPLCGCGRGGSFSFAAPPPNKSAKISRKLLPPPPEEVELPPQAQALARYAQTMQARHPFRASLSEAEIEMGVA